MTDRELLELAAKAAGIYSLDVMVQDPYPHYWNPLTDNGDALRLVVALRLRVGHIRPDTADHPPRDALCIVSQSSPYAAGWRGCVTEKYANNPEQATRRAIVRAAAEIGRTQP